MSLHGPASLPPPVSACVLRWHGTRADFCLCLVPRRTCCSPTTSGCCANCRATSPNRPCTVVVASSALLCVDFCHAVRVRALVVPTVFFRLVLLLLMFVAVCAASANRWRTKTSRRPRYSRAPIADLLLAGLVCLCVVLCQWDCCLSVSLPTQTEGRPQTSSGEFGTIGTIAAAGKLLQAHSQAQAMSQGQGQQGGGSQLGNTLVVPGAGGACSCLCVAAATVVVCVLRPRPLFLLPSVSSEAVCDPSSLQARR